MWEEIEPTKNIEVNIRTNTQSYAKDEKIFSGSFDTKTIKNFADTVFEKVNQNDYKGKKTLNVEVFVWIANSDNPISYFVTNLKKDEIKPTLQDAQKMFELTIKSKKFDLNNYKEFIDEEGHFEMDKKVCVAEFKEYIEK